ncbi:MAG: hypothetical protein HUU19_05080 [Phycisphaerales bacterium]|nr:hypothetical protein [Phycisphaerales bacterium]
MLSRFAIIVAAASFFAPAPALTNHALAADTGATTRGTTGETDRAKSDAWTCHVDPANQLYPSMIIAMATAKAGDAREELSELPMIEQIKIEIKTIEQTLGDPEGWLYVMVKAPKADTPIKVTIECPDVMEPSTFKGVLSTEGATYGVAPKIRWKYKDLARVRQPLPVNVVFKVKLGDAETEEDVQVCTLHTINDCPYLHLSPPDEKGEMIAHNISFLFAAYVNEDHPWVDQILKQAIDSRTVENFIGYQGGSVDEVLKQVYAVWNVLQQRGITYSDISRVSTREGRVPSQHVRFLDESFDMKQANCVDGSVLLASVLRKIGIDTFLMLTPKHCYIGFFTDANREHMVGLETTMMGQARKEEFERTKKLRALLGDETTFDQASFASFDGALDTGTKNLEADIQKAIAGEFQYLQVLIKDAREQGIRPIPYVRPEQKELLPGMPAELTPEQRAEIERKAEEARQEELRRQLQDLHIPKDKVRKTPAKKE